MSALVIGTRLGVIGRARTIRTRQPEARSHLVEDIDATVDTTERLVARSHGEDGDVGEGVHALVGVGGEGAVGDEAGGVVFGVDEVVCARETGYVCCWETGAVLGYVSMNL